MSIERDLEIAKETIGEFMKKNEELENKVDNLQKQLEGENKVNCALQKRLGEEIKCVSVLEKQIKAAQEVNRFFCEELAGARLKLEVLRIENAELRLMVCK